MAAPFDAEKADNLEDVRLFFVSFSPSLSLSERVLTTSWIGFKKIEKQFAVAVVEHMIVCFFSFFVTASLIFLERKQRKEGLMLGFGLGGDEVGL